MKKFSAVALAILLATILFFCGVATALVVTNVMEVKEAASWAQTVGGFLAIVAAFMIGNAQSKAAIAAVGLTDKLSYARKCSALLSVAAELKKVSDKALGIYETRNTLVMMMFEDEWNRPLDTLLDELKDIRAHEFGNQKVLATVISLKVASSYMKNMLERMPDALKEVEDGNNWNKFNHLLKVIEINQGLIAAASTTLTNELATSLSLTN